jgi:LysM repeat protein
MGSLIGPAGARSLTSAIVILVASLVAVCVALAAPGDFAERDLSPPRKALRIAQPAKHAAAHSPLKRVKATADADDPGARAAQDDPDQDAPDDDSATAAATASSTASQTSENAPAASGDLSYAIHSGDSVGAISAMFHIPAEDIFRHNHLNPDSTLHIGQVIRIPNPYVAQVRQLQAQVDSLNARSHDQEHKLQEGNSKERAFNARIVELTETNRALEHDVVTLPWWRRATTVAVTAATLMFAIALASLLQWFLVRRRFSAIVVANERLSRLDQRYRTLFARAELRLQQLYGRRRAVVDSPHVRNPEDYELERLNRELKEVLENQMAQLGVELPAPVRRSRFREWLANLGSPVAVRSGRR